TRKANNPHASNRIKVEVKKIGLTPKKSAATPPSNGPAKVATPIKALYPATKVVRPRSGVTSSNRLKAARLNPAHPSPDAKLIHKACSGRKATNQKPGIIAASTPDATSTLRVPIRSVRRPQYLCPKIVVTKVAAVTIPQKLAVPPRLSTKYTAKRGCGRVTPKFHRADVKVYAV